MRRIVQYPPSTQYSEIKISPQWHQWLRHTRKDAPSLTEQSQDLVRQRNLKILAAQADARWAAKPSFLDAPGRAQPLPTMEIKDPGGYTQSSEPTEPEEKMGVRNAVGGGLEDNMQDTNTPLEEAVANGGVRIPDDDEGLAKTESTERSARKEGDRRKEKNEQQPDPWKQARGGPSEEWQPQAWTGGVAPRRRS